jgi:uncharacterized protein YdaU (DUF1376 family)
MAQESTIRREALSIYRRMYYQLNKEEILNRRYFRDLERQMESSTEKDEKVPQPQQKPPRKSKKKKPPKRMTIETSSTPFILSFD